MAYERVAGILGQQRDDLHAAQISERVTNAVGGTPKGRRPPAVKDFLPDWTARPEEDPDGDDQEFADPPGGDR